MMKWRFHKHVLSIVCITILLLGLISLLVTPLSPLDLASAQQPFPEVIGFTSGTAGVSTSHVIGIPGPQGEGDFLLIILAMGGADRLPLCNGIPTGWELRDNSITTCLAFKRSSDATEPATVTWTPIGPVSSAWQTFRISGADLIHAVDVGSSSFDPLSTNLTISGRGDTSSTAQNVLWIAMVTDAGATHDLNNPWCTGAPTNYDSLESGQRGNSYPNAAAVCTARRELYALEEDPGAFTVDLGDPDGGVGGMRAYTVAIWQSTLTITSSAVTTGTIDVAYSYDADSNAGIETETWTLPTNPGFLSIDSETGEITGTPTEGGYLNVIVQVDAGGDTATQDYNITVDGAIAITSTAVTTLGQYSQYVYAADSNYATNETWELTTNPEWLSVSATTGLVTASPPTVLGEYDVVLSVDTDIAGDDGPATQAWTIVVGEESIGGGGPGPWDWPFSKPGDAFDLPPGTDPFIFPLEELPECKGDARFTVLFESNYEASQVNLYIWDFGDGSPSKWTASQQIEHEFPNAGTYTIIHAVQLNDGTTFYETGQVEVGRCRESPVLLQLMASGIALLTVGWLAIVFTRTKRVMTILLTVTVAAAGILTVLIF